MKSCEMKRVSKLLLVIFVGYHCIRGSVSWYTILNGTREEAEMKCKSDRNGNITVFRNYSSKELRYILQENQSIRIWNGYHYTSAWLENTGCFNDTTSISGSFGTSMASISISYCERFCKSKGQYYDYALKESKCLCVPKNWNIPRYFNKTSPRFCSNKCINRSEEHCGSRINSTFYNIFSAVTLHTNKYLTENGSCLLYSSQKGPRVVGCNYTNISSKVIACRSGNDSAALVRINETPVTWISASNTCIRSNRSYLVSYADLKKGQNVNLNISKDEDIWLNERKYATTLEQKNHGENLDTCEIISQGTSGNVIVQYRNCSDVGNLTFICKIGEFVEEGTTSTITFSQSRYPSPASQTSKVETTNGEFDEEGTTSTITYSQSRYPSPASQTSKVETTNGMMSKELSKTTSNSFRNAPIDAQNTDDGSVIGGAIGALVVVIVIGTVIIILIVRKRETGSRKEESEYHSQKVNYSKSNGLTKMAYCSEATLNIIQGNPDRISQEYTTIKDEFRNSHEYTTIQDEKLQNIRVSNSESDTFENKNQSSPTNGPLYMVLEETHSKSEINDPSNYELAQPICDKEENENASLQTEGREQKEEAMDYDHLRQEAYKQNMAKENVYIHAETDNDYSHISQVTKTNKNHIDDEDDDNDYDHTGNVQNHELTSNTGNDQVDTYAHAGGDGRTVDDQTDDDDDDDYAHTQTKESHHQTSIMRIDQDDTYVHAGGDGTTADGMRDIGPYDLAQNVRRPDDDSKEYSDNIRGIGSYEVAHNVNRPDVDDQESSNDMREIGPYEFAHNIDRRENGTTESTQDTFVQQGTEEGNYSLAEPIDMNDSGQYE